MMTGEARDGKAVGENEEQGDENIKRIQEWRKEVTAPINFDR